MDLEVAHPVEEPTAAGWALAPVARALPKSQARDLHRLLGHLLRAPAAADLRYTRLGLILQLLMRDGEPPGSRTYNAERKVRLAEGEWWPESTSLSEHYGGWPYAVRAAADLYGIGTRARVPSSRHHIIEPETSYTPEQIELAIIRCREKLGHWPAHQEFLEWSLLERRAARETAKSRGRGLTRDPNVRWPSMTPIRTIYGKRGGYEKALAAAQRRPTTEET